MMTLPPSSPSRRPRSSFVSSRVRSTICAGAEKVRLPAATAGASSITAARSSIGPSGAGRPFSRTYLQETRRLGPTAALIIGILAIVGPRASQPRLVWNASASVPVGLYRLEARMPRAGELAVVRLPPAVHALATERGYLGADALLIKPVGAGPGDVVCRRARVVSVNGRIAARVRYAD